MSTLVIVAALSAFGIGIALLWSHMDRFANQAFAILAAIVGVHLLFVNSAVRAGAQFAQGYGVSPVPMLRTAAAISMFIPWLLWIVKESLVTEENEKLPTLRRSLPWLCLSLALATLCLTNSYYRYSAETLPIYQQHGFSYAPINILLIAVYIFFIGNTWFQMRLQTGIRRIEMQFLVLNTAMVALLAVGLAVFSHFLSISEPRQLSRFVIIAGCALTAWAIGYYRIFDVHQVFISLAQRVALVIVLGLGIYITYRISEMFLAQPVALIFSVAIASSFALWLDRRSRSWLGIDGEKTLEAMRRAVIEISRTETRSDRVGSRFVALLSTYCNTSLAALLLDQGEFYSDGNVVFAKTRIGKSALWDNGWATPESLVRRRPTVSLSDLRVFLSEHSLGLIIAAPRGSTTPSLLIAFGVKHNEWPFTYPEVQRLQNIAELMDNILTHSRLSMQAAMRAKMEHLAMMSRGLAHDFSNLITPISSFLVYTDDKSGTGSPEREVHAAAQRSVRVMKDYIREALFFSDRLTARFGQVDLPYVFQETIALASTRGAERGVTVAGFPEYNGKFTADAVLLQRMLVNIAGNAIDASKRGQTVTLSATPGRAGWVCLRVEDEGCGISAEDLQRIFDPYFTTKRYGDDIRGFGLGLTTCQKIAHLHGGTISVTSQPGLGTTVTIDLPVEQAAEVTASAGSTR